MTGIGFSSPWHAGEVALQRSIGMADRMAGIGKRVIRTHILPQHAAFYESLPFVVLTTVDPDGRPWITLRAGHPGFLHVPDPGRLRVTLSPDPDDPAQQGLAGGEAIAVLGIDPATKRRNRLNGTIARVGPDGFDIAVVQSFGNCPQYIHRRFLAAQPAAQPAAPAAPRRLNHLDGAAGSLVRQAGTLFVASYVDEADGTRQADASHRGGPPGFVTIEPDGALTIPDYAGNRFFNTLGNILRNPRAGLVVPDFTTGDLLQMTGDATILGMTPSQADFPGAERLWRFQPRSIVHRAGALPLRDSARPVTL